MDPFVLHDDRIDLTLLLPDSDDDRASWDPRQVGTESDIAQLVDLAQAPDLAVISGPANCAVAYTYADDADGGAYCWMVDVGADSYRDSLRLASFWCEQRKIVVDGEDEGAAAVLSILREAVDAGNEQLARLAQHPPGSRFPIGERRMSEVEALDHLAAYLGARRQWNGGDVCELAARLLASTGRPPVGDQTRDDLRMYRAEASRLGYQHD